MYDMKEKIEKSLSGIEQAFILYFGEDNKTKIQKIFDELIIIGFSDNANPSEGKTIEFINKDLKHTKYSDKDIEYLIQSISNFKVKCVGFCYQTAPQSTVAIRTDCLRIDTLIHEITHAMMVEEIAKLQNDDGEYIETYKIFSTQPSSKKGTYTDEIITDGITGEVLKIYNELYSTNYKHDSRSILVDNIINSTGMKIFELLQPAIKKYILKNAQAITKIMGKDNYIRYSNLLQNQIRHVLDSECRNREDYTKQYKDYISQQVKEGEEILFSVSRNVRDYENYETDIEEYAKKMIEKGEATRLD